MLFWLKKALTIPFMPLHFALITGGVGLCLLWRTRHARLGRFLLTTAFLGLALFSNKGISLLLLSPLEHQYPPIADAKTGTELPAELQGVVAIAVLGGGHGDAPSLSRVNQLVPAALSRTAEAVRLSILLPRTQVIFCGNHRPTLSHARVLAEAAMSLGLDPSRVVLLEKPRDTEDEIRDIREVVGTRPVAIVTSAWHLPRAMKWCEAAGLDAVPCPADYLLKPGADRGWKLLGFELAALERSSRAIREYLGMLWLSLRGV